MGFLGIGKRTEQHEGASHGEDESQPKPNFFTEILAGNKHPHDPEAPKQHSSKQQATTTTTATPSHPQKSLFAKIFGNKKTEHQHGDLQERNTAHHPPHKHHWFVRILHRIELFLRICTLVFLVAGVVVLAVDQASNITSSSSGSTVLSNLRILDIASYKYILAAIIIGQTYIIIQIVVSLCRMVTGISRGFISLYFDFLGDKILSYLLATGAAAAYGASVNMEISGSNSKGKTAANLVLIAFFFSAISSVISSHSLPKHPAFL